MRTKWQIQNPERVKQYNAEWRANNQEKITAIRKAWVERNRERVNANARRWYQANKKRAAQLSKEQSARRIAAGLCAECVQPRLPSSISYCEKHWAKQAIKSSTGKYSGVDWQNILGILHRQNMICPYTGAELIPGANASLDHRLPKSRFPDLITDIDNLEWVRTDINIAKNDMTRDEFISLCFEVVLHQISG